MEHLINEPIEAEQLGEARYHLNKSGLKLCFFYHKWINPGFFQKIHIGIIEAVGEAIECKHVGDNLFKCEVVFDGRESLKIYNIEQVVRIKRFARENNITEDKASILWIKNNAKAFYEENK